ncbi:MAG: glycosyltransferase family 39 protein [Thermomicrobiales bacterium]
MSEPMALPTIAARWLRGRQWLSRAWPLLLVLAIFAGTALIVPSLTPVATTDDWGYSRSVEILLDEGRLTVYPVVAATAVFQIGWGAAFGLVFGMSLGIVRVSTLVIVMLGAAALYGLLRELGVRRGRSALGTAAYLFNPLLFVLSFTFMTDSFLTSLIVGSAYCSVRGLKGTTVDWRYLVAGSALAACAFLTRQQGILVPVAIGSFLLLTRRLRFDWASVKLLLAIAGIPALALGGYYVWLSTVNDIPAVQASFTQEMQRAGLAGTWRLGWNLLFIVAMYLGFFTAPLVAAVLIGWLPRLRQGTRRGVPLVLPWLAIPWVGGLVGGLVLYGYAGKRWPYIPQFVNAAGLGPSDVLGSRTRLFGATTFAWSTAICAIAALIVALVVSRGVGLPPSGERTAAGIVAAIVVWQFVGVLPPSFHYLRRGYSLDRYLLPLLPLIICLVLWAARDLRLPQAVGWALIAGLIAYNVAATRDYLTFLDTVWTSADEVVAQGVPATSVDAGAGWDGYHLYTYGLDHDITRARTRNGPWWMTFYALASDSTYVVSSTPRDGYKIMWTRTYDQWLVGGDVTLYVLRRADAPALPDAATDPSAYLRRWSGG